MLCPICIINGHDLVLNQRLGKGAYGDVFLTEDGFAVKLIAKSRIFTEFESLSLANEINYHFLMDHENIVKLYSVHEV